VISLGQEVASGCFSTRGDASERLQHPDGRLYVSDSRLLQIQPGCSRRHAIVVEREQHVIALLRQGVGSTSIRGRHGQPGHIPPQVVEQVRAVAVVARGESEGVEVIADAEAVGDGPVGVDRPEGGEAVGVVAQEVESVSV
jgi:hypothetical protein